jgi:hypothetical protein
MARERSEPTIQGNETQDWGRDSARVEIYGSDLGQEASPACRIDRNTAVVVSVVLAAAATIVLVNRKRRESFNERQELEFEPAYVPEAPKVYRTESGTSRMRQLADKQLERVGETFDDVVSGLVGAACGKIVSWIADAVPSFRSEYERASMNRTP